MQPAQQHLSPVLSPEIWTVIFRSLRDEREALCSYGEVEARQSVQQLLLELRRVCKKFHSLHTTYMHLLSLSEDFPASALPSLLTWMRRSKVSLRVLQANCRTDIINILLGAMIAASMPIQEANLSQSDCCTIDLLSALPHLRNCALSTSSSTLNLQSLKKLPDLRLETYIP